MALTVKLYQFSKRENSTKVPANTDTSIDVSVLLKSGTDVVNPVLILDDAITTYTLYNYAYIADFSRYYFITKMEYVTGNRVNLYLSCDVLGSFKTELLTKSAYISYSLQGSTDIPDFRLATTKNQTVSVNSIDFPLTLGHYSYFICMTGKNGVEVFSAFISDIKMLFEDIDFDLVTIAKSSGDAVEDILVKLSNAFCECFQMNFTQGFVEQNLRSAYMIPCEIPSECLGTAKEVYAGQYSTNVRLQPLKDPVYMGVVSISIPWGGITDWRRLSPFTDVYLFLPGVGTIKLTSNDIINYSTLFVSYAINFNNGDFSYSVQVDEDNPRSLYTASFNIRSEYGVGSSNTVSGRMSQGFNEGMTAMKSGGLENALNMVSDVIGAGLQGIANITGGFSQANYGGDGLGGSTAFELGVKIRCWCITKNLADTQDHFKSLMGMPLMMVDSLASHTGFLETVDFIFDSNRATITECSKISRMCNQGIYIE